MKNKKNITFSYCIGMLIALSSCNSGNNTSNDENINDATIQSIYPPSGTSDFGIGEKIQLQLNKNLKTSTLKKYILVKNNNSQHIDITVTGSNGIYYIKPQNGFLPNSQYEFNIKIPLQTTKSSLNSESNDTYIINTQPEYKIYVTSAKTKGWLGENSAKAKTNADLMCNTDSSRPDQTVTYKAMLGIPDERYPCNSSDYCGSGHNLDWVLQSSTAYFNNKNETIATTDIFNVFDFPSSHSINNVATNAWTGFLNTWERKSHCEGWTYGGNNHQGRRGNSSKTDSKLINDDKHNCDNLYSLYCAQQPQAIISSPELSPINQYMISDMNSPITVKFNTVSSIESTTVTANSFTIMNSSTKEISNGNISPSGNNSYTFTPNIPYTSGSQYLVTLTSSIKDINGNAIKPTTLFFTTALQSKLIYITTNSYWGNLGGVSGADSKCQTDSQCPTGKTCKAIIMDTNNRYACTSNTSCGGIYSKDWVLEPFTTYINTLGQILATTNSTSVFGNNGAFVFNYPISANGGKAWTGFDNYFMANKDANCQNWSIGDSGINKLGGLYGNSGSTLPYVFTQDGGGCSKYTNKVDYGVYVDKQCNAPGGCSTRHLYCAEQ